MRPQGGGPLTHFKPNLHILDPAEFPIPSACHFHKSNMQMQIPKVRPKTVAKKSGGKRI